MPAQHGERRAQLVPGVVDELALGADGTREAVEHGVEAGGQLGDVVVPPHGSAPVQLGLTDGVRRLGELGERAQQVADDPPRDQPDEGEHRERHEGEGAHEGGVRAENLVDVRATM